MAVRGAGSGSAERGFGPIEAGAGRLGQPVPRARPGPTEPGLDQGSPGAPPGSVPPGHRQAGSGAGRVGQLVGDRWQQVVERWAPVGLRSARADPGRRGAAVLVLVALAAALIAGYLAWHGRPRPETVAPPPVLPATAVTASAGPSAAAAPLVVAVTGRVRRPGVVSVPAGARVIDAVRAAGGPLPGVDLATLNLARKVADGELVVVGLPGQDAPAAGAAAGPGSSPGAPVDLNAATLADLDTLPGVGPVLAQRILDRRTEQGPFTSVDQLADVPGIGESRLAQLRDLVRV